MPPFGQPAQTGLAARPMRPQMRGGVNRPQLGAGGPRQGLSPSYARSTPLINTPPEGPSTQGYGVPARPSAPSAPKLQPTGGVQMGAVNQVGTAGSMNPNSGMMGGMAARNFGNMGRPGLAFQPQTPLENRGLGPSPERILGGVRNLPVIPNIPNIPNVPNLAGYREMGQAAGQDMSWMDQPGAISPEYMTPSPLEQQIMASKPEAMANMGAVSNPGLAAPPQPRMMNPDIQNQLRASIGGGGLGPSRRMFGMR